MSGQTLIIDGLTSKSASVDNSNRLKTHATTEDQAIDASLKGNAFSITTGVINLTSDNLSYILYVKNNESFDWVIKTASFDYGATESTGDFFLNFAVGPIGGTLITGGSDSIGINLNLGSAKQLGAGIKVGQDGSTIEGGRLTPLALIPEGTSFRELQANPIIVTPGTSFAVGIKPPVGNVSMNCNVQFVLYREDEI